MIITPPTTRVLKYHLVRRDMTVDLPWGTQVLTVGVQQGGVVLWAAVPETPDVVPVPRRFITVATGERFHEQSFNEGYIGTVFPGDLVFHVFEVKP